MNDRSRDRDDELLSAYLDGELEHVQADALEWRLAHEPALAERLEAMRVTDRATAAAFRAIDERPMPKRVLDLLGDEIADGEEPRADNVVPLRRRGALGELFRLPVVLAAGVALAAGLWLGALSDNGGAAGGGDYASRIVEGSPLFAAFERVASGATVALDGGRHAEPVLTFLDEDGAWCRQVRIIGGSSPADTLACRRDGAWQVELVAFGPAPARPDEGAYGQASAAVAPAMRAALDELMGREPPLGAAQEADVIGRGWQADDSRTGVRE